MRSPIGFSLHDFPQPTTMRNLKLVTLVDSDSELMPILLDVGQINGIHSFSSADDPLLHLALLV